MSAQKTKSHAKLTSRLKRRQNMKKFSIKNRVIISLLAGALGCTATFANSKAWAEDGQFSLSSGFDPRPGEYATNNTTGLLSIPTVGKYETGPWVFKLTVPDLGISGTGNVVPEFERIRPGSSANNTQYGFGNNTVAAATYNIYSGSVSTFGIGLTGKVKLGMADKLKGLGIGQNDYAAQADAYQSFDKFTALGSLGYKFPGNPAGISSDSVIYGSFGGIYQLNNQMSGGVDISLAQSPSAATTEQQRHLTAYVSHMINKSLKARGYVLKGFTNGSPDTGLGAQVYYGF
jgi:hypothetical protein